MMESRMAATPSPTGRGGLLQFENGRCVRFGRQTFPAFLAVSLLSQRRPCFGNGEQHRRRFGAHFLDELNAVLSALAVFRGGVHDDTQAIPRLYDGTARAFWVSVR